MSIATGARGLSGKTKFTIRQTYKPKVMGRGQRSDVSAFYGYPSTSRWSLQALLISRREPHALAHTYGNVSMLSPDLVESSWICELSWKACDVEFNCSVMYLFEDTFCSWHELWRKSRIGMRELRLFGCRSWLAAIASYLRTYQLAGTYHREWKPAYSRWMPRPSSHSLKGVQLFCWTVSP